MTAGAASASQACINSGSKIPINANGLGIHALSMTGQVLLQVIEGRKGAGAPDTGEAVTPEIGRG